MTENNNTYRVAIAGLGAIGLQVARALDAGIPGLALNAISVRDREKAARRTDDFTVPPRIVDIGSLADQADVIVECTPAATFRAVAEPAIKSGRIFMPLSVGALLDHWDLVDLAKETGARIMVPTGALLGLDAVRAAAEGNINEASIVTRKPPAGLKTAPLVVENGWDMDTLVEPMRLFEGSARDAIKGFPANVNVAVALSLAGIGPDRTRIEIWADPAVTRNTHRIRVDSDSTRFDMTIEGIPTEENPATGKLTPLSTIACLRGLTTHLKVGT